MNQPNCGKGTGMPGKKSEKDNSQTKLDFSVEPRQTRSSERSKSPAKSPSGTNMERREGTDPPLKITITESTDAANGTDGTKNPPKQTEDGINKKEVDTDTGKKITYAASRHTPLPENLMAKAPPNNDPYEECEPISATKITFKELMIYKIIPFANEDILSMRPLPFSILSYSETSSSIVQGVNIMRRPFVIPVQVISQSFHIPRSFRGPFVFKICIIKA